MDDLISKRELLTNLIHCKGLGRQAFQVLIDFLDDYPIEVNMNKIKEQIKEVSISRKDMITIFDILDKGGI